MIGLIDGNAFYASCERSFRPDLIGKSIVVLSSNDGCVIARSHEAKAMGIPMGAPFYKIKHLVNERDISVFSSNFTLYGDMSSRMMSIIEETVPKVEIYSIDEAFLDFTGISNPYDLCVELRAKILKGLGLPTSIGIAPTKVLSKIANHLAKKKPQYGGICIIEPGPDLDNILKTFLIEDIWGIGRRLSDHLKGYGITTAYDLKKVDPRWMRKRFTVVGERIVRELNGIPCLEVEDIEDPRKSIQVSRSFGTSLSKLEDLEEVVSIYATRLGEKLRARNLKAGGILVSIRTNPFSKNQDFYKSYDLITFSYGICDTQSLITHSKELLKRIYKPGLSYKKAGILAINLHDKNQTQYNLFEEPVSDDPQKEALMKTLDQINKRYGRGSLYFGACGSGVNYKDNRKHMSPAYTTKWADIPIVYAA